MGYVLKLFIIVAITAAYLFLFVVLAEIGLRKFTYYGVEYYMWLDAKNELRPDDEIPYIPKYLEEQIEKMRIESGKNGKNVKSANSFRVMVIGDSIAVGGEMKQGEAGFPLLLRDILQKDFADKKIELFVFAQGGYSTAEEVEGFKRYSSLFRPDMVILSYCHNDTAEAEKIVRRKGGKDVLVFYKKDNVYIKAIPLNGFLSERFLVARLLNEMIIGLCLKVDLKLDIGQVGNGVQKVRQGFEKLYSLTKFSKIPVVVLVFPYLEEVEDISRKRMTENIERWCSEFNFIFVDLRCSYAAYDYRKLQVTPLDPTHPNLLGHEIAAEAIRKKINAEGLIKPDVLK